MFFTKTNYRTISMEQAERVLAEDASVVLLDVRTAAEYEQRHIPGSRNLPLDRAGMIASVIAEPSTRLFVYCLSGARSRTACDIFTKLGYTDVTNIGSINAWSGATEGGCPLT